MSLIIKTAEMTGTELKDSEGGGIAILKMDGSYRMKLKSLKAKANDKGNVVFNAVFSVQDEDEKGALIYWNKAITGEYSYKSKSGESLTQKNIKNLTDLLDAAGLTSYKVEIAKAGSFDAEKIVAKILADGTDVHGFLAKTVDNRDGSLRTEIKSFMFPSRYETNKTEAGRNWRRESELKAGVSAAPKGVVDAAAKQAQADAARGEV